MYLQLSTPDSCYELKFESALNCIVGDSATGKTHLVECLKRYKYTTDASMVTTTLIPEMLPVLPTKSMVVLDIDDLSDSKLIDSISTCGRDDVCFVLLGRKYTSKLSSRNISLFQFITSDKVTRNVRS